ncbi:hypothetical protein HK096_010484, partial [Nowakowskiella sp. JEL0078]
VDFDCLSGVMEIVERGYSGREEDLVILQNLQKVIEKKKFTSNPQALLRLKNSLDVLVGRIFEILESNQVPFSVNSE